MTPPQRLAFVAPRYPEAGTVGGAETLLKNLAVFAAEHGCTVDFLTTCADNHFTWENTLPPGVRRQGKVDVHYFPVDENRDLETFLRIQEAICNAGDVSEQDELLWMKNNVNSSALYQHLRDHGAGYDCILMGPYLFSLVYASSQIHPSKTFLVPCLHDEAFAYLSCIKKMFQQVAGFLFNTLPEAQLARRLYELSENAGTIVGMGLDSFTADGAAFKKKHGIQQPYIIYCGRREPLKGTPLLLDYMQAFRERTGRDVKLVFTGSGPIEAEPELWPHILDAGFVSEEDKHNAMAGAAAFIHPSVNESLGIVLLESWLAETPALVHAQSNVLQWQCASSHAGLWFNAYPEFEEQLCLLLDHPELNRKLGTNGRAYVEREYTWDRVGERFFEALNG